MTKKSKPGKAPVKKKSRAPRKQATTSITDKHRLYAMHYALTGNAEQSAKDAGFTATTARKKAYAWVGISRQTSHYPLLYDLVDEIRETHLKPKIESQFNITADKVLTELARLGFSDIRQLFNDDGAMKPINELSDDVAVCISSIEVDELYEGRGEDRKCIGHTRKVKLWDKKGPLELLAHHLGIIKNKVELTGKDGKPIDLATKIIHEVNFKKSGTDLKRN
jgi:phage terminase small subunit